MVENKNVDNKSLSFLKGKQTDWDELAKDCVAFANAQGGFVFIGIEDKEKHPPLNQSITDRNIPDVIQQNIAHRTINVGIAITIEVADNKAEYIKVQVFRSAQTIASTTDGKYYVRVHDECRPVPPDEMARLAADKNAFVWEEQTSKRIPSTQFDEQKRIAFLRDIRNSQRVSSFIKEMSDEELLDFYFFQKNGYLTNLGILWIGKRNDRASLLYPPAIQVIRYDDNDEKVWKLLLDEYFANPKELLERVLNDIPDWQESIEVSEGMFRKNIPFFSIEVVRELIVNALVHRTYTTRGDIFINIYPDRMEIHSPGRLPFGVTPKNILSQSIRRNEHLSKIFYDLGLMEKEGSGYDLVYAKLLGTGKPPPIVKETDERVSVIVKKQFVSKEVVRLMDKASTEFALKQKELISLGLLAQQQSYTALEISRILNQNEEVGLRNWLGRLLDFELVVKTGKGKGTQYAVNPEFIRQINFKGKTNLKNIEDYRLEELIYKDIKAYPNSGFSEIHQRIGLEINKHKVRRVLKQMVDNHKLKSEGVKKWVRYFIEQNL
ncbi:MAG TPA: transcriptional regulator [Rikenellaceae bacterium]|jgi:ATP-dependent DNA helicase RecG|nr:MAG: transcriptional regulator [Bacteroidetes bacterium GWE2_40_15]PKP06658.1 MAG: transcriptional regulator [Bacteroidetes bacterium HGW-Bacteroidetes-5]HBZ25622.1 transcriptional regulator [Rikenellaceae bacterium]